MKVEAINPPKSQTTPPPTHMIKEFLEKLFSIKNEKISIEVSIFLYTSPSSIL